jgi:hypothetical protein
MVDSDIRLPTNWLTTCLENLESNAGVGGVAVPDGDCSAIQRIFHLKPKVKTGSIEVTGNNSLFRTDALIDSGQDWLTPLGEDFRLNRALYKRGFKLKRIDTLVVQHIESKSYSESLAWLYTSGVDATRLWLEFKITRIADLASIAFIGSVLAVPLLFPLLNFWSFILPLLLIMLVGLGHLISKFYYNKNSLGFIIAWLPNSFLMLSYFVGRIFGIMSLVMFRIERE